MRRSILAIVLTAGAAISLAPAAGAATPAATRARPTVQRPVDDARRVVELECAVVRDTTRVRDATRDARHRPAVGCHWRHAPDGVAGYRLVRSSRAGRKVVLRTDDLDVVRFLDDTVEPGKAYSYVLQWIGPDGRVVARSRPELVRVPAPAGS